MIAELDEEKHSELIVSIETIMSILVGTLSREEKRFKRYLSHLSFREGRYDGTV